MVFTRRHRRLGSGDSSTSSTGNAPHVVKTYGRVRHRTVNRDSNSAHKFALAASARPTVAGVVDDGPSDSDFEKEEPTPKPTAQSGHLSKARPTKTRGSPQMSPADNGDTPRPRQPKAVSGNGTADPGSSDNIQSLRRKQRGNYARVRRRQNPKAAETTAIGIRR
ncbi:hypothetical protein DL89DRAFT_257026 [Linderina pennispora]|uniref:Uncharacterized protein n=1 Tax=Linderina pennispora TaxID=61395 RepID=A0A1Y1WBE0_9FUNG|nr:uncharacterized protein DL89DRAFT_257026 [Linderina pennispora]ORX70851.1 hypothetical protein DL89DRAFT_257026 [Linderina pennispora]